MSLILGCIPWTSVKKMMAGQVIHTVPPLITLDDDVDTSFCKIIEPGPSKPKKEETPMEVVYLSESEESEDEEYVPISEGATISVDHKPIFIVQKLGQGVFGKVFRVQSEDNSKMAMKVQDYMDATKRVYALKEEKILDEIVKSGNNKFIVDYYGSAQYGTDHLLFFELMDVTLEELLLKKKAQPTGVVSTFGMQIFTAIAHLHSIGIVHTDIKPTNILLPRHQGGMSKLCDFGNAMPRKKLVKYTGKNNLMPLMFRSPEVYLGIELNEKIDVWSLGCVLAEIYTGCQLFPANTVFQLSQFHCELLNPPSNYFYGSEHLKYLKVSQATVRPLNDIEFSLLGVRFEKDCREMALHRLEDIKNFGYNQENGQIRDSDYQFIDLMKRVMEPNNVLRVSAAEILRHALLLQ